MLPKHQYSWSSGQMAPLAMRASAMIQGSTGALELLGRILLRLNQKRFLNRNKKSPEFPKCLHHILPCQTPFSCYCIAWARGSKRTQLVLGRGRLRKMV